MNKDSVSARIRELIAARPDMTSADLKEEFGNVTRSIQTLFCYEYKKMYGKTRGVDTTIKDQVIQYFQEHPGRSMNDARKALPSLTGRQIRSGIQRAEKDGIQVPRRKEYRQEWLKSDAHKIREYALEHPLATSTECAQALGVGKSNANNVLMDMRKKGMIPQLNNGTRGKAALTPFQIKEIKDLLDTGHSVKEICKITGISHTTIYRYKKEMAPSNEEDGITAI